jgi:hypothetical protein
LVLTASSTGLSLAQWFARSDLLESVLLKSHPFPFGKTTRSLLDFTIGRYFVFLLPLPPLALALIQTRRLFRQDIGDKVLATAVRYLLPIVVLAFAFSFAVLLPFVVVARNSNAMFQTLFETHSAVGKLQLDMSQLSKTQPQQIALADLSRVAPLSNATRTLLRGATITVRPKTDDLRWLEIHKRHSEYFTTIRFSNDWNCTAYGGPYVNCRTSEGESLGGIPP